MSSLVGQPAPEIDLPVAGGGDNFKLSDSKGKEPVVLLFFPLAWTGICTQQMCDARDAMGQYTALGAKVIGISVDSQFALAKFKEEQGLTFDLASDANRTAVTAFGNKHDEAIAGVLGVAKRSAFVIDKDGIVVYADIKPSPKEVPAVADIKAALEAAAK